ncbi:hypothetical protein SAMD00024442_17_17 [Candidatus Symbiothrix dinenymphae]|nr:hypothetical protein SAMD00024442_17_17 [Candidatus Symbiothrix dinenymphae]
MKKSTILLSFYMVAVLSINAQTYSGGSGTQLHPYLISTKADMLALSNAVYGGTTYSGKYFLLTSDLTGSSLLTTSVGNYEYSKAFGGTFDGGGHEIEVNNAFGVFGYLSGATIQYLGVKGTVSASSSNSFYVGGICGCAKSSTISYCYNSATITASSSSPSSSNRLYAGGICGYAGESANLSSITNCYNLGSITSSSSSPDSDSYAGGICGGGGSISSCFSANSTITAKRGSYNSNAGRIVGSKNSVNNCYALSSMTINGTTVSSTDVYGKDGYGTALSSFQSQAWIVDNLLWDFNTVWKMSSSGSANQGLPIFKNKREQIQIYTITTQSGTGISATTGSGSHVSGTTATVGCTVQSGYTFDGWYENSTKVSSNQSYSFTVTATRTLQARATQPTYTVNATSNSTTMGTVSPSSKQLENGTYTISDHFSYTAKTGYRFVKWTLAGSSTAITSFTVRSATINLVANFENVPTYTVNATSNSTTMGIVSPPSKTLTNGTYLISDHFTPTAATGYHFVKWTLAGNSTAITTFTVNGATGYLTANFEEDAKYTITASANTGGSISPNGEVTVNAGTNITFRITPNSGYAIYQVLVDDEDNAAAVATGSCTFTNVTSHHSLAVRFRLTTCLPDIIAKVWDDVLLVNNNSSTNGGYTFTVYQWQKNGIDIQGETSGSLSFGSRTFEANDEFLVLLTTTQGEHLQSCPIRMTAGTTPLRTYPNPTEGQLTVEDETMQAGDKIMLFDISGQMVHQTAAEQNKACNIDLSRLQRGTYLMRVNEKMKKIIKN